MPIRKTFLRLGLRLAAWAGAIAFLWLAGPTLWDWLSPFIIALALAASLQPVIAWSRKRLGMKYGQAAGVWATVVCLAILLLGAWVVTFAVDQIIQAAGNSQSLITGLVTTLEQVVDKLMLYADSLPDSVAGWLRSSLNEAISFLAGWVSRLISTVVGGTVNVAAGIPYAIVYANFLIMGLYFITAHYPQYRERMKSWIPASLRPRAGLLLSTAGKGLVGYIRVQTLFALVVLTASWACLQAFGFPYALLIALLAAALEFLPLFGNGTLFLPWALIAFVVGSSRAGFIVLCLHLALLLIRRATEPRIMSSKMGLSPFLALVSMFVGMRIGGVAGLVGGPIVAVVLTAAASGGLFQAWRQDLSRLGVWIREVMRAEEAGGRLS